MDKVLETLDELRATKHEDGLGFKCGRCGHVKLVQTSGGTGYGGYDSLPNKPVCYACCGELDKEAMTTGDRYTLYLVQRGSQWFATNWPGTLNFAAEVKKGNHNWAHVERMDAWFTDHNGKKWWGLNLGDSQILRCRKLKEPGKRQRKPKPKRDALVLGQRLPDSYLR